MRALVLVTLLASSVAFADGVDAIRAGVPKADARKRGPLATGLKPALVSLGAQAVPEMISAFEAPIDPAWTQTATLAWKVSLLEAMGTFQDARTRPVFEKVLADGAAPYLAQRAAAEGLAKLGDLETLGKLLDRDAVVAALGSARTHAAARALAHELGKHPAPARAKLIVKSLGEVGNAWAWATLPSREQEQVTRNEAAAALVGAFVAYDGEVRQAASNALLVVDSAAAPALIAQAKASGRAVRELEALQLRLSASPMR